MSGDDGEESFHERLKGELSKIPEQIQDLKKFIKKKVNDSAVCTDNYFLRDDMLKMVRDFILKQNKRIGFAGENTRVSDGTRNCFVKQVYYLISIKADLLLSVKEAAITKADREKMNFCLSVYENRKESFEKSFFGILVTREKIM